MENTIQAKVNKIGTAGKIISIILIVLLSIGAFGLVVSGIVCAALPRDTIAISFQPDVDVLVGKSILGKEWGQIDEAIAKAQERLDDEHEDVIQFEKTEQGLLIHVHRPMEEDEVFRMENIASAVWAGFVSIVCSIVTLVMLMKLSDAFRVCRSPFDEAVIKRMTSFAWTLIVCAVVGSLASSAASAAVMKFQNAGINIGLKNTGYSLNLAPIFTALIVFFLCTIFRYGAQLQQEADETL